jgi:hypothetical protein
MSNDGGPAFPDVQFTHNNGDTSFKNNGMTLRDYFAGQVLAGIAASRHVSEQDTWLGVVSYKIADHMLRERMKNL